MPYLTNLDTIARRTGYPVTEVDGWKTRGHGPQPYVKGIVAHHTAGHDDMKVVRDGRPGLDGPLSHFWLKHDGSIYVIAAGRCWHNAPSTSLNHSNSYSIGIEAENDGKEPWPEKQLDAYYKLCAELCKAYDLSASAVKGHKEVNTSKVDPHSLNMNTFRSNVAKAMGVKAPVKAKPKPGVKAPSFPGRLISYPPMTSGSDVKLWQTRMHDRGWSIAIDGLYGPDSRETCIAFQKEKGLSPDGIVGPKTWDATWEATIT